MKKIMLTFVVLSLMSFGCGNLGNVQVQGNPTLTVTVDTDKLSGFFMPYCVQYLTAAIGQAPTDDEVTTCTNQMIANFLATMQGEPTIPVTIPSPSPSPTP